MRDRTGCAMVGSMSPHAARRRFPRWAKVILSVVAAIVICVLALFGVLWWNLEGGWDGIRRPAQADDRAVVRARADVREPLRATTAETDGALRATLGEPVTGTVDSCEPGQNNWKVHDGYTLRCTAGHVLLYTAAPQTPLDTVVAQTRHLADAGWRPEPEFDLEVYGDTASARFQRGPDHLRLRIEPPTEFSGLDIPDSYDGWNDHDVRAVEQAAGEADGILVTVVVTRTYFEDS